jgi:hypothetical protein
MTNQYLDFYKYIICDNINYVEFRCFKGDYITSKYFKNEIDIIKFIKQYRNNVNLYCGVNPKKTEGRKDIDTAYLKNIIFDLEAIGEKFPLIVDGKDSEYFIKLKKTINFIQDCLFREYNLDISAVVISGRGLHIYITINNKDILFEQYKSKYSQWYKSVCNYINKNNPYTGEIKVDSPVGNFSRILGAPGSIHSKYPEKPIRKIIYINTETNNDIKGVLDKQKEIINYNPTGKKSLKNCTIKKRYTNKTIFEAPEYQIFKHHPIEGTGRNNKLLLALQLLINRDGITNIPEIKKEIENTLKTTITMNFNEKEYPNYKYSENIINNYVIDNYKWSVQTNFKLPYDLKEEKKLKKIKYMIEEIDINIPRIYMEEIKNINDLLNRISNFNKEFKNNKNNKVIYYTKLLERSILDSIKDEYFKKFVIYNNLINRLKFYEETKK